MANSLELRADAPTRFLTPAERGCIINLAVGIAQLVEHRTVAPTVAGSIPVSHPRFILRTALPVEPSKCLAAVSKIQPAIL